MSQTSQKIYLVDSLLIVIFSVSISCNIEARVANSSDAEFSQPVQVHRPVIEKRIKSFAGFEHLLCRGHF